MELRTTFIVPPSEKKISYSTPSVFIGSCFATSIGRQFELGRMPVVINPFGTVYNPASVYNTINTIIAKKEYSFKDLFNYEGKWLSFSHYTDFSSVNPEVLLERINRNIFTASSFLSVSKFLFITFGTAWVYELKQTGRIVSNCHKLPASEFTRRMLSVEEITSIWTELLVNLSSRFPELQIVFTVSPVRYMKDGAHSNQISKSILFLAIEELQERFPSVGYFPAYELIMDDLRDYRFYENDMLHPSTAAIEYIWEVFKDSYFDEKSIGIYQEIAKIIKAREHKIHSDSSVQIKKFAIGMIEKIDSLVAKFPFIELQADKEYFSKLIK